MPNEKQFLYKKNIGDKILIIESFYPRHAYNIKIE
jgi:hypothetical protein